MNYLFRAVFVILFLALLSAYSVAQPVGLASPIDTRGEVILNDHSEHFFNPELGLQAQDLPAILRFSTLPGQSLKPWTIVVRSDSDQLTIDSNSSRAADNSPNLLEIQISDAQKLSIRFSDNAPDLVYGAIIHLTSGLRPLFQISKQLKLHYAQKDLNGDAMRVEIARAIVRLDFDVAEKGFSGEAHCTGFQFSPGQILTNWHCADPTVRPSQTTDKRGYTTVVFGIDDTHSQGQAKMIAQLGRHGFIPAGHDAGGLDYAVLISAAPPAPFNTAVISLTNSNSIAVTGTELELYQIWSGFDGAGPGNVMTQNAECVTGSVKDAVGVQVLNDSNCPLPDFFHGCDEEGGSSGAPVMLRGTNKIVGVNWGGIAIGTGNCAVGIEAIKSDLEK